MCTNWCVRDYPPSSICYLGICRLHATVRILQSLGSVCLTYMLRYVLWELKLHRERNDKDLRNAKLGRSCIHIHMIYSVRTSPFKMNRTRFEQPVIQSPSPHLHALSSPCFKIRIECLEPLIWPRYSLLLEIFSKCDTVRRASFPCHNVSLAEICSIYN